MAYNKQTWSNSPTGGTPITAERLTVMENGIGGVHTKVDTEIAPVVTDLQSTVEVLAAGQATTVSIDRMTPGSVLVIDYYKTVYGAANAWPATRPTARTDLDVVWRGPTDPGTKMLAGDIFELAEGA